MVTIDHIGIVVPDLAEAESYFSRLFEEPAVHRGSWRGSDADYVADMVGAPHGLELEATQFRIPHSDVLLEFIQYTGVTQAKVSARPTDVGGAHIGFYVDSIAAVLDRRDLPLLGVATDIPYGPCVGGRTAYLKAPGDINLQLMQVTRRPGGAPVLTGADFWVDHFGMVVADLDSTVQFFEQILDAPVSHRAEWRGANANYVADTIGLPHGLELEAAHIQLPYSLSMLEMIDYSGCTQGVSACAPTDLGAIHLGLHVDHLRESLARWDLGFSGPLVSIPYGPSMGGVSIYVRSPDGVHVQLTDAPTRPGSLPILRGSEAHQEKVMGLT
jgi:catechol 2,3-dioxygenase-like lactoylglutathione lyase family enzyme